MREGRWLQRLWDGDDAAARAGRSALLPFEALFGAVTGMRGALYDRGLLPAHETAVPAVSVGNLTVGGTGKTPLAAWIARDLHRRGARPAIVLRGYGDDEPLVHRTLNPDVPVFVSADRVAASREARRAGCDVVVLDDAFQHRRARRVADIVVVSADRWRGAQRHLLPAGPWRERLGAARRASIAVVTRKAATLEQAGIVADTVWRETDLRAVIVHLEMNELRQIAGDARADSGVLMGETVLAISGIGDPAAFHAQLALRGATVVPARFGDHHHFTPADAAALAVAATRCDRAICTLKDAVKLAPLWPGPTPLWYVSQRVTLERGAESLNAALASTLAARSAPPHSGRPGSPGLHA